MGEKESSDPAKQRSGGRQTEEEKSSLDGWLAGKREAMMMPTRNLPLLLHDASRAGRILLGETRGRGRLGGRLEGDELKSRGESLFLLGFSMSVCVCADKEREGEKERKRVGGWHFTYSLADCCTDLRMSGGA